MWPESTLDIMDVGLCAGYALDVTLDIACAEDVQGYVKRSHPRVGHHHYARHVSNEPRAY